VYSTWLIHLLTPMKNEETSMVLILDKTY
jgi:hypothetical protein